jgi:hypothetical protein
MTKWQAGIFVFAAIEIFIGVITLAAVTTSLILGISTKPLEVLVFVLTTSTISLSLGIVILRRSRSGYHLLIFFSLVVILSKLLIFAKIISLSGALETTVPSSAKNIISLIYHSLLILFFSRGPVKKEFGERRRALFSLTLPFTKC